MKLKLAFLSLMFLSLLISCNKKEKDHSKHFEGKRKDPSSAAHLVFHDLSHSDSIMVNDTITFDYTFNNNGFQTALIGQVENLSANCKCSSPDSIKAGKNGIIRAKCAFDQPGIQKGVFKVAYKGAPNPIALTFFCTVKEKK